MSSRLPSPQWPHFLQVARPTRLPVIIPRRERIKKWECPAAMSSKAWRKRLAKGARRPGPSSMKPMHPRYFDYAAERSTTGTTPRTPRRRSSSRRDCTSINLTLRDLSHLGSTASRRTIAGTSSASEEPTGSGTTANRSSKNSKTKPQRLNRRFCSTRPSGTSVTPSPRSTIDLGSSSSSVTSPR